MAASAQVLVVGAGIVGAAVAREILLRRPSWKIRIYEKEDVTGKHQTGRNSGVVHAGLYYAPDSLKASLCRRSRVLLRQFCLERDLPFLECGKLVIAKDANELARLEELWVRASENGVPGLQMLNVEELRKLEPNVSGLGAMLSPETAITDFMSITEALLSEFQDLGGRVRYGAEVSTVIDKGVMTEVCVDGRIERFDFAVVCAGLQSDRIAAASGFGADVQIVPFSGRYFNVTGSVPRLRRLVYPVPDPDYPFLGVHVTRTVDGGLTVGPNAFLALSRERYSGLRLNVRDGVDMARFPGFWKFASRNVRAGAAEAMKIISRERFIDDAISLVPGLRDADFELGSLGIRAQAIDRDGRLVDDFLLERQGGVAILRNAPSPGATSALGLAEYICEVLEVSVS